MKTVNNLHNANSWRTGIVINNKETKLIKSYKRIGCRGEP